MSLCSGDDRIVANRHHGRFGLLVVRKRSKGSAAPTVAARDPASLLILSIFPNCQRDAILMVTART